MGWLLLFSGLVFGALLGAVAFRVRGGWLGDLWDFPGQLSRLIYGAIMAVVIVVAGWPWPFGLLHVIGFWGMMMLAWFVGAVAMGTLGAIDAGRVEGSGTRDFFLNAVRGMVYGLPPALLLALVAWHFDMGGDRILAAGFIPLCGTLQSVAYEAAWRVRRMEQRPTELAEYLTGAALGVGSVLAVIA